MAMDCNSSSVTYWNNQCTDVKDVCSYYDLAYQPDELDSFKFTMCKNATDNIPLDKVRTLEQRWGESRFMAHACSTPMMSDSYARQQRDHSL